MARRIQYLVVGPMGKPVGWATLPRGVTGREVDYRHVAEGRVKAEGRGHLELVTARVPAVDRAGFLKFLPEVEAQGAAVEGAAVEGAAVEGAEVEAQGAEVEAQGAKVEAKGAEVEAKGAAALPWHVYDKSGALKGQC
ncbi:MAG: hypothetical protein ACREMZ_16790, partial [Gemmatimonadales bacterium]